jgi:hypothetical protein
MSNQKILMRVILVSVFWITALFQMLGDQVFSDDGQIVTAFAASNVKLAESKLELTAEWRENRYGEEEKRKLLLDLADKIGFHGFYEVNCETRNNQTIHFIKIQENEVKAIIELITEKDSKNIYGYMELSIMDQMNDILAYKAKIERAYQATGAKDFQTILKFYGEYPGQLSYKKQNQEVKHLFHNLKAQVVSEINEDGIYTVYGYTKMVKDYMQVFRHKINLNVAFSYNEERNITNLYLATPIISGDY